MKPKTKSELMAEWAGQPGRLKKEREVKAVRKAMDDARAVMQDGLTRYVKKKTKARSMAKAEANPFAELEGWESMEQIQDAYGYGEITADRRDKLTDLWEAREEAQKQEEQQRGRKTLHMFWVKALLWAAVRPTTRIPTTPTTTLKARPASRSCTPKRAESFTPTA